MVGPTQLEIDTAVMVAKNATYKLAYELALERKYGGNIDCCVTKLKLLWLYRRALACQLEYINSYGYLELTTVSIGVINVLVDGVTINGGYTIVTSNKATEMTALAAKINSYQDVYIAYFDASLGSLGKIKITGDSCVAGDISVTVTDDRTVIAVTEMSGGVCASNCLTDEKAKKLIAKINSMCNKQ